MTLDRARLEQAAGVRFTDADVAELAEMIAEYREFVDDCQRERAGMPVLRWRGAPPIRQARQDALTAVVVSSPLRRRGNLAAVFI